MKTELTEVPYAAYLDGLPYPVITTDNQGFIRSLNKEAEMLFQFRAEKLLSKYIGDILQPVDQVSDMEQIIAGLYKNSVSGEYLLKKGKASGCTVTASLAGVMSPENELTGAIITFKGNATEYTLLQKLEVINHTLAALGDNYLDNVNQITALCGKLLGGSSALYNRLNEGLLCSLGRWETPADYITINKPEGRICYDVIRKATNDVYFVRNLPETSYAISDPNVLLYNLQTYIGQMVRCNGEPAGSLCVVFQRDYEYSETDQYLVNVLALALENEETRASLRKSKDRYSELFDFAVEGILISSSAGIITDSNSSMRQMTGFEKEELVGCHISEVLFTRESLLANPFNADELLKGMLVVKERDIRCKNQTVITVEMHSKMMPDGTFRTAIFDITSRKSIEKRLQLSENTYRGIIDNLNDAVYFLDKEGCFIDVNDAAEKLYGYPKEYFLKKTPEFLSAPGMNNIDHTVRSIQEAYEGKPSRFEFWGLRRDTSVFPKEVSLSPGLWFGEKIVIAVGREMTERKAVEESLKMSEEKYRLLVQYSSDPIFSFNPDESYRYVNDAFAVQFGKKPDEIIGKTPFEIFPAEEAEKRLRLVRHVFRTGEKGEIEVKVVNIHNEEKFYLTMVDPIKDSLGKIMWVTCISKDITQRKKSEEELRLKNEQLKATNAEKDKFFSIIAHDLRGPMNGFLGLTGIMAEDIENLSSYELKEIATTMRASAVNIYRLIENLLQWSKMQRGAISFEPQPMFLKSSLTKSIELVKDAASKKEIELKIQIPDHSVIFADINMLETTVRNLLSNAIKFSFKGGLIEITSSKTENGMIQVEIKDYGIGMSADLLNKLFFLTENTSRKGTQGEPSTGLGLILCKEFVEKQGGEIWAESIEGEGSSFIFTLPQSG